MSNALQSDNNRALIDQAVKEAYAAVEEAKEYIRQQIDGPSTMMGTLEEIEERIDRIDTEMLYAFGDIRELKEIIKQLEQQREEMRRYIWAMVKVMRKE
jgi:hypothetical protein